jgi:hypothetical protein
MELPCNVRAGPWRSSLLVRVRLEKGGLRGAGCCCRVTWKAFETPDAFASVGDRESAADNAACGPYEKEEEDRGASGTATTCLTSQAMPRVAGGRRFLEGILRNLSLGFEGSTGGFCQNVTSGKQWHRMRQAPSLHVAEALRSPACAAPDSLRGRRVAGVGGPHHAPALALHPVAVDRNVRASAGPVSCRHRAIPSSILTQVPEMRRFESCRVPEGRLTDRMFL